MDGLFSVVYFQFASGILTWVQLKAVSTDATDLDIWVSGGLVLANVGNFILFDVAACGQNWNIQNFNKCTNIPVIS